MAPHELLQRSSFFALLASPVHLPHCAVLVGELSACMQSCEVPLLIVCVNSAAWALDHWHAGMWVSTMPWLLGRGSHECISYSCMVKVNAVLPW